MNPDLSGSTWLVLLILLYGLLTLTYNALTNLRINMVREEAEDGNANATRVLALLDSQNLTLSYQVASALLLMSSAAFALADFVPLLTQNGISVPLAHAIVLVVLVSVTTIFGVLVPESIGSTYAKPLAYVFSWLMRVVIALLFPLIMGYVWISKLISLVFSSSASVNMVTEEEIMTLVEEGSTDGTVDQEQKEMIYSVLQLDETHASELMVPRVDMVAFEINMPLVEAQDRFISSGHSRIPVYEESIDNIKGLLYAKDLITYWHNGNREKIHGIQDLMRPAYFVPESKAADELLKEMQKRRVHMAIVVDNYGGTAGIVTIEDLIEEIIGDIQDEYDVNEEDDCVKIDENRYLVDASMDIDDFNHEFDADLPNDDNDTIGGFMYSQLGHIPTAGEEIVFEDEFLLRVEVVNGRRIRKVMVTRLLKDDDTGEIIPITGTADAVATDTVADADKETDSKPTEAPSDSKSEPTIAPTPKRESI